MPDDSTLIGLELDSGESAALPADLANPEPRPTAAAPATDAPETAAAAPATDPATPAAPVSEPPPAAPTPSATSWEAERAGLIRALSEERADKKTLRDQVNRLTGMVEAINRPTVTTPEAAAGPTQADLEDTARSLGLYKADGSGQLDLVAAKNVLVREAQRTRAAVEEVVNERVRPLQAHVEAQQAQTAVSSIYEAARAKGIEDRFTQAAIQNLTGGDPSTLANPSVQVLVTLTAAGMKQMVAGGAAPNASTAAAAATAAAQVMQVPPVAAPPPAFSPATGAKPAGPAAPELTALEKKAMRSHGIKAEDYRTFTSVLDKANETGRFPVGGFALED